MLARVLLNTWEVGAHQRSVTHCSQREKLQEHPSMNRPSGLQDTLTTSNPASPNSSTQTPKSLLETTQLCQSLSPSQHISVISMLITDTVHQFLPCTETNAETDWWLCKPSQLPIVYFSQIITSSCSRVQTSVRWEWLAQHHEVAAFYCVCHSEA